MAGTTYQSPAGAWAANGAVGVTGTINGVAATTDYMLLTGVVVLPGIEAPSAERSPLIMRPYDQELVTCQRYYAKSFPVGTNPANVSASTFTAIATAYTVNALITHSIALPRRMRATPTMTYYSPTTGSPVNGSWQYFDGASYISSTTTTTIGTTTDNSFSVGMTASTTTIGKAFFTAGGWTADIRL